MKSLFVLITGAYKQPKLLTGVLQGFGDMHFWLAVGFDFLFF